MLTEAQSGLWQVAIVWGVAIMVAAYTVGGLSGAHINPAITVSMCLWRGFTGTLATAYIASQLLGAMLAAGALFFLYNSFLLETENRLGVMRGKPGSEMTAMCYGEYYPNPARMAPVWETAARSPTESTSLVQSRTDHFVLVSETVAFAAEVLGTLILALVVFAVTDEKNAGAPGANLAPVFIGLTVAILISVIAPLTQSVFQPSPRFGSATGRLPRRLGRGRHSGPNGRGFFTVYIIGGPSSAESSVEHSTNT